MKVRLAPVRQGMHKSGLKIAGTALAAAMTLLPLNVKGHEKQDVVNVSTDSSSNTKENESKNRNKLLEALGMVGACTTLFAGVIGLAKLGGNASATQYRNFVNKEIDKMQTDYERYKEWERGFDDED